MKEVCKYHTGHQALMQEWKEKCLEQGGYKYFTEDGIVNPEVWFGLPEGKRVVFLLKEAYTSEKEPSDWNEAKWLNGEKCRESCPYDNCSKRCRVRGNSFNRIAEWMYCITELPDNKSSCVNMASEELLDQIYWLGVYDKSKSRKYNNAAYYVKRASLLKRAAVVNLKKADGEKNSQKKSMEENADVFGKLLFRQLELIQPYYVVCGGTMNYLSEEIKKELAAKYQVIDAPHPNAHISRSHILEPVLERLNEAF